MIICYLDEQGNHREPKDWNEVKAMYCDRWDSCYPCPYCGPHSRTHGGFECKHPMHPKFQSP